MAQTQEEIVKAPINGINLFYTDQGKGVPLVFIHAFPLSSAMWEPQIKQFSQNYRVVAMDLRGHGESDASLWHFTLDDYAEDIHALLTHLNIKQAIFIGLSMGGYTLFSLYRKFPEFVNAMVLADTRAQADSEEAKAGRFAMVQTAYQYGPEAIAEMMMPKILAPCTIEHRKDIVDRIRNIILKNQASGIMVDLMAMAQRPDSTTLLSQVSCPTLIIVGDQDVATPPAEAHYMQDRIPNSKLVTIPQAGHMSNLEQPEAFNRALSEFFAISAKRER